MRGSSSMDVSSIPRLCLSLIGFAFQRCRLSSDLCRLSVLLSSPSASNPSVLQVSISDTGVGSCLEEFHAFKCPSEAIASQNWDGSLAVRTTSISDLEVYHYQLNLRETNPIRRLIRLPSKPKNGVKFSGTEVCLCLSESIHVLLAEIRKYFQKILVLNIPNVAIELVAEGADIPGSRLENVFLANEGNPLPSSASNIERLKSGLENYLLKHGQSLSQKCECFPWKDLKVGSGTACSMESHRRSGLTVEVVIVLSEVEASCSHIKACSSKTEVYILSLVLYFKDFSPCSIPQSSLKALTSIDWKSFGLSLGDVDPDGHLIEWENSPSHIAMVVHSYHKQYPTLTFLILIVYFLAQVFCVIYIMQLPLTCRQGYESISEA
ncbi:hypothetical protein K2173_003267 [Erythroxylum novogranatense]|uniref:Uncharacterized protein n=1 Tax=Erythroxylum novogranatense TaxID=1862640 RepID=A0AAV8SYN6_9ROSI|nr:hypothetical protein K2173_003267 [Erythroxylum novogranatense]